MNTPDPDRLYKLLPSLYRQRDAKNGEGLRALMRLIGAQSELLRGDIQQLWDNFFIETCDDWVIPYLGDLVSNRSLYDVNATPEATTAESLFTDLVGPNLRPSSPVRLRADVAKTIQYRRRKGTVAMLQDLAGDVTGWGAYVVQFFKTLVWTQNVNHIRPRNSGCFDFRSTLNCARVNGPLDPASHLVDVRAMTSNEGWHNVPNLGFFLWRLRSFPLTKVMPRAVSGTRWRYTFSPLGNSAPLFVNPEPLIDTVDDDLDDVERYLPGPIAAASFSEDTKRFYSPTESRSFTIYEQPRGGGTPVAIPSDQVACTNLKSWNTMSQPTGSKVRVDVKRGRFVVDSGRNPGDHTYFVSFSYGFSAPLGSGPYLDRSKWVVREGRDTKILQVNSTLSLDDAVQQANHDLKASDVLIRVADNLSHALRTTVTLDAHHSLTIEAEPGTRPHLQPDGHILHIDGVNPGSTITLSGLLIEGAIELKQDIQKLRLLHCTLVPGRSVADGAVPIGPSLIVHPGTPNTPLNTALELQIAYSITGALKLPESMSRCWLLDSIIDGGHTGPAISNISESNGPRATVERCTILGQAYFRKLDYCSDTLFSNPVIVEQRHEGCLRFSFVPVTSKAPQQFHCQPQMEIISQREAGSALPVVNAVEHWLKASFESLQYGHPAYCQLRRRTPTQILRGGSDGAEIGAFNFLKQPQRETNLRIRLEEYVPFGRVPGIIFVT